MEDSFDYDYDPDECPTCGTVTDNVWRCPYPGCEVASCYHCEASVKVRVCLKCGCDCSEGEDPRETEARGSCRCGGCKPECKGPYKSGCYKNHGNQFEGAGAMDPSELEPDKKEEVGTTKVVKEELVSDPIHKVVPALEAVKLELAETTLDSPPEVVAPTTAAA